MKYSKSLTIHAATAAALLGYASAQEVHTEITAWSIEGCNPDPNDTSALTDRFTVWEGDVRTEIGDEYCTAVQWAVDGWPTDPSGDYIVYVDQSGIENDCELQFFKIGEPSDEEAKTCEFQYSGLSNEGACAERTLGARYGYAYCCDEACRLMEAGDIFGVVGSSSSAKQDRAAGPEDKSDDDEKKTSPSALLPPPVSDRKKRRSSPSSPTLKARDVCRWTGETTVTDTFGDQLEVGGGEQSCQDPDSSCRQSVDLSYSEMYSNSFDASVTAGASLFDIVSVEVSFGYTYEHAVENGFTYTWDFSVPAGGSGYVGFSPELSCVNGMFEGDCEWITGTVGNACFLKMNGRIPMGHWEFISTS